MSHAVSSSRIHCMRTGRPISFAQIRRLETRIVGRRAAVALRALHPDDAHLLARHAEERARRRCACRTTSCRSNRSSSGRSTDRPSHGAGRTPCAPGTGRRIRLRSTFAAPANAASGLPATARRVWTRTCGVARAHVREEILGRRERRGRRLLPVRLELPRRADRLLFALADDRDVVALAHHLDEARQAFDRRFVDARSASRRRPAASRCARAPCPAASRRRPTSASRPPWPGMS